MKTVRDYMAKEFAIVSQTASVIEAMRVMVAKGVAWLVVMSPNNRLLGILSATDLIRIMDSEISSPKLANNHVKDVMTPVQEVAYLDDNDVMTDAVRRMSRQNLRAIVVMNGLECVGVIDQVIIIEWWLRECNPPTNPS